MLERKMLTLVAVIAALVAAPALAQQPQHDEHHPPAAGPGMPGGMAGGGDMPMMRMMRMMMGRDGMAMMGAMARHVEGRLAFLKTELKITDAQLPLWNAVADAMRANAKSMGDMAGGMMGGSETANERGTAGTAVVADPDRAGDLRLPYCGGVLFTDGAHGACLWRAALAPDPRLSPDAHLHASWPPRRSRSGAAAARG